MKYTVNNKFSYHGKSLDTFSGNVECERFSVLPTTSFFFFFWKKKKIEFTKSSLGMCIRDRVEGRKCFILKPDWASIAAY